VRWRQTGGRKASRCQKGHHPLIAYEIGDYFEDRQIKVEVRVTDVQQFEKFLEQELREDLVAIWAGKRSLIDRLFPREWVGRFASKWTRSSLVMR